MLKRLMLAGVVLAIAGTGYVALTKAPATPNSISASTPSPVVAAAPQSEIQTLDVTAKGGYSPTNSTLKADQPAKLRIITQGTFDCSSSLVIAQLGYDARLPLSGVTEINIPPQAAGTVITGLCSMGMYGFNISFVN